MSHQRCRPTPLSDTDLRSGPGPAGLSERGRSSLDRHGYYGSGSESGTSSSSAPALPLGSTDSALSILSSCGLEPADLALLAELPEDKLTVESLPHLVHHIKSNREALKPPPVSSSHLPSSPKPPVSRWHQDAGPLVQYPLDHIKPTPLPTERVHDRQDHRQNPSFAPVSRSLTPSRSDPPSLSFRNFADARPGRPAATIPSLFSLPQPGQADRSFASLAESRWRSGSERGRPDASASQTRGRPAGATTPSEQEVQDFYGAEPPTYPTSCSLCNACVISAENWTKHINGTRHANGQLGLLQRFPTWDCRMETLNRAGRQSERRRKEKETLQSPQSTNESRRSQATTSPAKKLAQRSKVACVKFPAQSVDEPYLRKLAEPFGTITRILMFPSLAFVELESAEQAQELVKFHNRRPPNVKGQRVDFSISNAFNFVKSSCVVSFTPPPQSNDDKSDLLAVVKRFGPPAYTLFQPSKACIEMKSLEDAEKLVNYYSSNNLRINDKILRVSFAAEISSLRTTASAQRYQEESTERTRSGDEDHVPDESKERGAEGHEDRTRDGKARSRSQEKTSSSSAKMPEAEKPEMTASGCASAAVSLKPSEADGVDQEQSNMDADSEQDDSDIEGMAVLGEDLEGDHLESEDDGEDEDDAEEDSPEAEGGALPAEWEGKEDDCQADGGKREQERRRPGSKADDTSGEEVDLEDCITLDEVGQERSSDGGEDDGEEPDEDERRASRVVYFKDLPLSYCNAGDFVKLAQGLGRPVRYYLLRGPQKGFLELSHSSEALRVVNQLNVYFKNTQTAVLISNKYRRLLNGLAVHRDEQETGERPRGSRSEDKGESKATRKDSFTSDQEKEKRAQETPEREDSTRNSSDVLSLSKSNCGNAQDVEFQSRKTEINSESEETLHIRSEGRKAAERKSEGGKALGSMADTGKTLENKPADGNTHSGQSKDEEAPQRHSEAGTTLDVKAEGGKTVESREIGSEGRNTLQNESKARKRKKEESQSEKKESKSRKTVENPQRESLSSKVSEEASGKDPEGSVARQEENSDDKAERRAAPEDAAVPAKIQKETSAEHDKNHEADGTWGGAATALRPVGAEFVRPVVGYFCNLCQLIYADEDEAKVRHCSSRQHHVKYQEKMKTPT